MNKISLLAVIAVALCGTAQADIWKWVDANGKTHFVDSNTPIYTWVDEAGDIHYSDTPDHEDAVSVELVWHSSGSLEQMKSGSNEAESGGYAYPGETAEERAEREQAEQYYCKRATEIYESYVNAPRLFRTNDAGEREYLSGAEAAKTIAETRQRKDELCKGL